MASKIIWKFLDSRDLCDYTLIVPSVAVGNVSQLACDLLISSMKMNKFASLYSPALIPVLGYDPYDLASSNLSSCCEVYKCPVQKIAVVQFRAPLVYNQGQEFLAEFVKEMKDLQVKDMIILTSSYAHEKKHILTSPFRFVANEFSTFKDKVKELKWTEHELVNGSLKIYGGGFASLLYEIVTNQAIPCLLLFKYCSEGDNIPDAYDMVTVLNSMLPVFKQDETLLKQLVQPVSWNLLFGSPPPAEIY